MDRQENQRRISEDRLQEPNSRIRRVKAILGPKCHERAKAILDLKYNREEIDKEIDKEINKSVIAMMNRQYRRHHSAEFVIEPSNKPQKAAVKQVAQNLRKLNGALRSEHFPRYLLRYFEPEKKREDLQKKITILADKRLAPPKRPSSRLPRYAAALAAHLLDKHKLARPVTRGGTFCKLATAIYGDGSPDMYNHCLFYRDVGVTLED
jgi:hypothetical protein